MQNNNLEAKMSPKYYSRIPRKYESRSNLKNLENFIILARDRKQTEIFEFLDFSEF